MEGVMIDLGGAANSIRAGGMLNASIVLFDTVPGTKEFTVPDDVTRIRAFVIGAGASSSSGSGGGGGYSETEIDVTPGQKLAYVVGAGGPIGGAVGGSSSFAALISATGGNAIAGGSGIGGAINFSGGAGVTSSRAGGGAAAHRYGNGAAGQGDSFKGIGGGFSGVPHATVDGWGIGVIPGDYGVGGHYYLQGDALLVIYPKMGGGGGHLQTGGVGGGGGGGGGGGPGCVGVEVIR